LSPLYPLSAPPNHPNLTQCHPFSAHGTTFVWLTNGSTFVKCHNVLDMSGQKGLLFCFLVGEGNPRMTELNVAHISAVAAKRIPFFCLCGGPATLKIKSHTKKRRTIRGPLANKKQVGGKHNCFGLFLNSTGRRCWPRRVCAIFQSLSHINLKSQSNLHKICFLIRYSRQPEVRGSGARRIRDDGQHGGAKVSGKRNPSLFSQCTSSSTSTSIIQNVSGILWPLPLG